MQMQFHLSLRRRGRVDEFVGKRQHGHPLASWPMCSSLLLSFPFDAELIMLAVFNVPIIGSFKSSWIRLKQFLRNSNGRRSPECTNLIVSAGFQWVHQCNPSYCIMNLQFFLRLQPFWPSDVHLNLAWPPQPSPGLEIWGCQRIWKSHYPKEKQMCIINHLLKLLFEGPLSVVAKYLD